MHSANASHDAGSMPDRRLAETSFSGCRGNETVAWASQAAATDEPRGSTAPGGRRRLSSQRALQFLGAASLLGYSLVLHALSQTLDADGTAREWVTGWSTAASIAAGAIYLIGMRCRSLPFSHTALAWTFGALIAARLVVSSAPPMLETDFQRYLWDGAVTTHGINPFEHAPADVLAGLVHGPDAGELGALSERAGGVLASINHPQLTTIYPPLAQFAFAIASWIQPFGVGGLRCVLAASDALTLYLLIRLLRGLSLPTERALLYAANPLLLRETYVGLHMDVLVLPFLVGAILVAVRNRWILAGVLAVAGSAVKVWPALLLPMLMSPARRRWKAIGTASILLAALALVLWAPALSSIGRAQDGFDAYRAGWQNNDGFFRAGIWVSERALSLTGFATWHSQSVMRWTSGVLIIGVALWQARSWTRGPQELPTRALSVVGASFLLSPTQFPWYWIWCLPMLALQPSRPLLLYTALLPLYYVQEQIPEVYWIEHAPVWGLVIFGALQTRCIARTSSVAFLGSRRA